MYISKFGEGKEGTQGGPTKGFFAGGSTARPSPPGTPALRPGRFT